MLLQALPRLQLRASVVAIIADVIRCPRKRSLLYTSLVVIGEFHEVVTWFLCMAPEEEKLNRRNPLDFPIERERPKPGRRPDLFPQFSPMKTPLPPPLPCEPPEEDEGRGRGGGRRSRKRRT